MHIFKESTVLCSVEKIHLFLGKKKASTEIYSQSLKQYFKLSREEEEMLPSNWNK